MAAGLGLKERRARRGTDGGQAGGPHDHRPGGAVGADAHRRRVLQIRLLHLLLALLVAVLSILWASQRGTDGVRSALDDRLRAAGAGVNAGLVVLEAEQLSLVRAVTFTQGVPQALAASDVPTLNRLVTPLQANSEIPMVDMLRTDGTVEFAVRSRGAPAPVASRKGMPAITESLAEARGAQGGRFTQVVVFRTGPVIMTIGPILEGSTPVGLVLAMTPLADELGRLQQEVGTTLSAYDSQGRPLATSATAAPPSIPASEASQLMAGAPIQVRYIHGGQREELGRLVVDHQTQMLLGVALPDPSAATGEAVAAYSILGLCTVVIVLVLLRMRLARLADREAAPGRSR